MPDLMLQDHSTKAGVWGLIRIVEGQLVYRVTERRRAPTERLLGAGDRPGVVEPEILHKVEPKGRVRFFVEFVRKP